MAQPLREDTERAYGIALRFLSRREYAEARLTETLLRLPKRFPNSFSYRALTPHAVREAILRCKENGLIDDNRFSIRLWEMHERTHGPIACVHLLMRRGINRKIIERLAKEKKSKEKIAITNEIDRLAKLRFDHAYKRFGSGPDAKKKAWTICLRFLAGRGYAYADAKRILEKCID